MDELSDTGPFEVVMTRRVGSFPAGMKGTGVMLRPGRFAQAHFCKPGRTLTMFGYLGENFERSEILNEAGVEVVAWTS